MVKKKTFSLNSFIIYGFNSFHARADDDNLNILNHFNQKLINTALFFLLFILECSFTSFHTDNTFWILD